MILCQISDPHIRANGRKSYLRVDTAQCLRDCVRQIGLLPQAPDAVVITGDLADGGDPDAYAFLRGLLEPLTVPFYLLPGNHDDRANLRAAFAEHDYLRQRPERIEYVIEQHALRLIALDTVIPGTGRGELASDSMGWLDAQLAQQPQRPTVVLMHHPPFESGIRFMDKVGLRNPQELERVVRNHPQVERVLCGHVHRLMHARFGGTIASTSQSTAHHVLLDLAPDDGLPQFIMEPPGFQLHVWRPPAGLVSHTVYVGAFDGPHPFCNDEGVIWRG